MEFIKILLLHRLMDLALGKDKVPMTMFLELITLVQEAVGLVDMQV